MQKIIYSICITNHNTFPLLKESLQAILSFIDDRFEVVVIDQNSTDGSKEILQDYARRGLIRLFFQTKRCRGLGRQLAFENSKGLYIISQLDLDDVTGDFRDILTFYHEHFEGRLLVLNDFTIGPRSVIEELGGWRDLNWGEDFDLWSRAARAGKLIYIDKTLRIKVGQILTRGMLGRARYDYYVYRDSLRLSKPVRHRWKNKNIFTKWAHIAIFVIAYLSHRFYKQYKVPFNRDFKLSNYTPLCDFS